MFPRMTMGLPKTEKEAANFDEMRKEIEQAQYDSALIRRCLEHARWAGLSGEDKYVMLAYYALKQLETHYQMNMDTVMTTLKPSVIVPASALNTWENQ
jgi:hypothetical protein